MSSVLLIEPDVVLAKTYAQALTSEGHKVASYGDVQTAIAAMDKKLPQLIIMELQLGNHNGVEFLYEMRSYPDWDAVPVIVLSRLSEAESGLRTEARENLGIKAYYYKPTTSLDQLLSGVTQVVQ